MAFLTFRIPWTCLFSDILITKFYLSGILVWLQQHRPVIDYENVCDQMAAICLVLGPKILMEILVSNNDNSQY